VALRFAPLPQLFAARIKTEQAVSRVLCRPGPVVIIPLGPRLPGASRDLPGSLGGPPLALPYLVLLQAGFS